MKMPSIFKKTGVLTLALMIFVIFLGVLYLLFRDQSILQKRNDTPAATALLPDKDEAQFTDLQGQPLSLAPEFGQIIVVFSWASWCPSCTAEFGRLSELAQTYKDKGVVVLAVNRKEDKYSAERFLATIAIPKEIQFVLDPADYYFANSSGYAMPETIVYAKNGDILTHQRGEVRLEELKQAIDKALE
jgi:thiol-disulfide isomerase/thioredoxin